MYIHMLFFVDWFSQLKSICNPSSLQLLYHVLHSHPSILNSPRTMSLKNVDQGETQRHQSRTHCKTGYVSDRFLGFWFSSIYHFQTAEHNYQEKFTVSSFLMMTNAIHFLYLSLYNRCNHLLTLCLMSVWGTGWDNTDSLTICLYFS